MKNWKTTLAGILIACGTGLQSLEDPPYMKHIGSLLIGIGGTLIGFLAKDYDTTGIGPDARKPGFNRHNHLD